jgi:GT2 family glycosyltransferase
VLNWNGYSDTIECLNSLLNARYGDLEIILVDNGSTDGSGSMLKSEFWNITYVETGENLGYAGGNNAGIELALRNGAELLLIVNNDVTLQPEAISALVDAAAANPGAGILGCIVYRADDPDVIEHAGAKAAPTLGYHGRPRGMGQVDRGQFQSIEEVDWVTGCALMLTRDLVESVGWFDPDFFCYCEDMDLCLRGRKGGYSVLSVPGAKAWHKGFASSGGEASSMPIYYYVRNANLLAARHAPPRCRLSARLRETVVFWSTVTSLIGSPRPKVAAIKEALRGLHDYRSGIRGPRPE